MREIERKNTEAAEGLRELARAEGLALEVLEVDVTSDAHVERAAGPVLEFAGAPDAVINNAGQMFVGVTEAYTSA
jgi:NAD(P)-dependent dehydrogenase (short-subunit alcohol dehydrogenase family)